MCSALSCSPRRTRAETGGRPGRVRSFAVGHRHDDHLDASSRLACDQATGQQRLVVGVGYDDDRSPSRQVECGCS